MGNDEHGAAATRGTSDGPAGGMQSWYALSVMSRQEFTATAELRKKGLQVFLPTVKRVRQWSDRRKLVEFPLFSGYLFVRLGSRCGDFAGAVAVRGAVRILSAEPGRPSPISNDEIDALKRLVESGNPIDVYPGLRSGTCVRIRRGPLAGLTGVIGQPYGADLFLVHIDILGRSVGTRICADDLEAA